MRRDASILALAIAVAVAGQMAAQDKGGEDETGPYDVVENWLKPLPGHDGWTFGPIAGVFAETPDRIYVLQSGELPVAGSGRGGAGRGNAQARPERYVFVVDRNGRFVQAWTQWDKLFIRPHKVTISPYDPDRHVWIVDDFAHQIFKFTNDGSRLVLTLGEKGVAGADEKHFGRPTDLAFFPDGTFLVSDGYENTRVMKFDKDGKFLSAWGSKGTGPGQFNLVHCVVIDANRRVYVLDRDNHRLQVFDENGKFLDQWPHIRRPTHLILTQDQYLWLSDGLNNKLVKYDLNGRMLTSWGTQGTYPGALNNPHQFSVDADGSLYIANYLNRTVTKFTPKANADRSRVIGPRFVAAR